MAAGEDQLLRKPRRCQPRQTLRPAPSGEDAQVDLWLAQSRVVRREPDVTGQYQLTPPSEGESVDRGDDRLAKRLNTREQLMPALGIITRLLDRCLAHVPDIGSSREGLLTCPRDHNDPDGVVRFDRVKVPVELIQDLDRQRVELSGVLQRQHRDRTAQLQGDRHQEAFATNAPFKKSTICCTGAPGV